LNPRPRPTAQPGPIPESEKNNPGLKRRSGADRKARRRLTGCAKAINGPLKAINGPSEGLETALRPNELSLKDLDGFNLDGFKTED